MIQEEFLLYQVWCEYLWYFGSYGVSKLRTEHNIGMKLRPVDFSRQVTPGYRSSWLQNLGNQSCKRSPYLCQYVDECQVNMNQVWCFPNYDRTWHAIQCVFKEYIVSMLLQLAPWSVSRENPWALPPCLNARYMCIKLASVYMCIFPLQLCTIHLPAFLFVHLPSLLLILPTESCRSVRC